MINDKIYILAMLQLICAKLNISLAEIEIRAREIKA